MTGSQGGPTVKRGSGTSCSLTSIYNGFLAYDHTYL